MRAFVLDGYGAVAFFTEPSEVQLREIAELVDRGAIRPVIDREFPFEQLPAALRHLETGRARGKVMLRVR
jgi:alcohol dehydrogenase